MQFINSSQGQIQRFGKGVGVGGGGKEGLYVGHHGWRAKKILGFRWPKKDEITLESIISISIFIQQSIRKEKLRKVGLCFITCCFIKPFKMIINFFFKFLKLIHSAIFAF